MTKTKIGIVGHFGGDREFYDGQTVKTKNLYRALQDHYGADNLKRLDTFGFRKKLIPFFFDTVKMIFSCKNVVMLPDENGVRVFIPLYSLLNIFLRRKLHYCVVGGWLPVFLKKHKLVRWFARRLTGVYVETSSMKDALEAQGFKNVVLLPNFKYLDILSEDELQYTTEEPLKLCIFSRIMEEKGVEDAIGAVKKINEERERTVYALDLYGQIDPGYTERFSEIQKDFPPCIRYMGTVAPEESVGVLRSYYALLFPTKFYTEGIPGTLIDAYAAGIPVITALWANSKDIFTEGVTGWGYPFGDTEAFTDLLRKAAEDPALLLSKKTACLAMAKSLTPAVAVQNLVQRIK